MMHLVLGQCIPAGIDNRMIWLIWNNKELGKNLKERDHRDMQRLPAKLQLLQPSFPDAKRHTSLILEKCMPKIHARYV